jgi:outer membrane protein TolC
MTKFTTVTLAVMLVAAPPVFAAEIAEGAFIGAGEKVTQTSGFLTLDEAVKLALASDDPYLQQPNELASSFEARAVSDSQLADPKFNMKFANWPLNSLAYTQEPMTQIQVGVSQAFPKGDTLELRRAKRQDQASGQRFQRQLRVREVILDTRISWLELNYIVQARLKVAESRQAVAELIEVIQAIYATGRQTTQDVLRAELELSLLDDRLVELERQASVQRAKLARRIGSVAFTSNMPTAMPVLQHPADVMAVLDTLGQHPAALVFKSKVDVADQDVKLAGEQYKPGWAVNVGYGARGSDRADFASVGVSMDVPLFTGKRQDKRLQAAKKVRQASKLSRDTVLLDLQRRLQVSRADWDRLKERVTLYQSVVLARARDTTQATLSSYQSGVSDFPELIRSRLGELDAELKLLRLQSDRLKAQSQLLFLEGEDDA